MTKQTRVRESRQRERLAKIERRLRSARGTREEATVRAFKYASEFLVALCDDQDAEQAERAVDAMERLAVAVAEDKTLGRYEKQCVPILASQILEAFQKERANDKRARRWTTVAGTATIIGNVAAVLLAARFGNWETLAVALAGEIVFFVLAFLALQRPAEELKRTFDLIVVAIAETVGRKNRSA